MRGLLVIPALVVLTGCLPTRTTFHPVPLAAPGDLTPVRGSQSRVLAIPLTEVFPKVLEVLLDQGYQVRSANARLGLISFFRQWSDTRLKTNPTYTQEGTLLLQAAGPGATRVRLGITARSEENIGEHLVHVSGVQANPTDEDYRLLLDLLEHGMISNT